MDTWINTGREPLRFGLCYHLCNYLESKEAWKNPGSFTNALKIAKNFTAETSMMNYARSQVLREPPKIIAKYVDVTGVALAANRIYRAELWVGATGVAPGAANHEIIIITGDQYDVIYFEPNFGFFQVNLKNSVMSMNNAQAIEYYINKKYAAMEYHTGNFRYSNVRSNAIENPLSFTI